MAKKYILRIKNAGLFDIEERRMEAMARKGWIPESISKHLITLKQATPMEVKCRLVYYNIAEPGYRRFVDETQEKGWRYISSDGISQTLFMGPADIEDISIPQKEQSIIKSHRAVQGGLALLALIALAFVVLKSIEDTGSIPLNRVFIYAAWLVFAVQWAVAFFSETRNMRIVVDPSQRRTSAAEYLVHVVLKGVAYILLVTALIGVAMF